MFAKLRTPIILLVGSLLSLCSAVQAATDDAAVRAEVGALIVQLGHDEYLLRQQAETKLVERGIEAFAQLKAAESNPDLEISTRASYILSQMSIEWVRSSDPPTVRSMMGRFGELPQSGKLERIARLAELENEEGFAALCRIARFESAGVVARYAALAIMEKGLLPKGRIDSAVRQLDLEMGKGQEAPISWVIAYADQLRNPTKFDSRWIDLLDAEIALYEGESNKTTKALVLTLLRTQLDLGDDLSDAQSIMACLQRRVELGARIGEAESASLIDSLVWLMDREQWAALELFAGRYADLIKQERLALYHLAVARERQDRPTEEYENLADQAWRLAAADAKERNNVADVIAELGHHDWAEREWQEVIDTSDPADIQSLLARQSLGSLRLNDRGEHQAAAELLAETIDAVDNDPVVKQQYQSDPIKWYRLNILRSLREFFLACHAENQQDYDQQRQHLEQSYKLDPSNADVLIAMYRLPNATKAYRKQTQERIIKSLKTVEIKIKKSPNNPHWYNHWAWLASNTDREAKQAVKYSQKSLELEPGAASYLDTLGRCYYAAGDLENALDVQRQAVAKHPHLMVMQRQLKLFEDALAERDAAAAGE